MGWYFIQQASSKDWTLIIPDNKVHGANMGPPGADRTQVGPMLAPWTLLSGILWIKKDSSYLITYGWAVVRFIWEKSGPDFTFQWLDEKETLHHWSDITPLLTQWSYIFFALNTDIIISVLAPLKHGHWDNRLISSSTQHHNHYADGLVLDCSISSANALEILQSCTKPSMHI